jgi:SRSO17 transposase
MFVESQGTHSVGFQRQCTGSFGKLANCQNAVSSSVTSRDAHTPVDFELYMPRSWTDDDDNSDCAFTQLWTKPSRRQVVLGNLAPNQACGDATPSP